jgi:uncharacterized membrane protein
MHLLFWQSLIPFTTAWLGKHQLQPPTVALYGFVLLMNGIAYAILEKAIIAAHGVDSDFARALGKRTKDNVSVAIYVVAVVLAFFAPLLACALYILVALLWLVPDKRFETAR